MIQTRNNQIRFDTRRQHVLREENAEAKTAEEIFARARALASEREFFRSRTLLHFVLNTNPNYHDARTLLGTTYGWEGNYDSARLYIRQVLQRNPLYLDAYVALADVEYWAGQNAEARAVAESGLTLSVGDPDLLTRKARSLWLSGERTLARQQVGAVLARFPTHPLALDLNKKMTNENL